MIDIKALLDHKVEYYNRTGFINDDPICIPHKFSKKQDIEISAFFAALLAWGNRKTIINSCKLLFDYMDNDPHNFIINFSELDFVPLKKFVHRTFNSMDLHFLLHFLKTHYKNNISLENAFSNWLKKSDINTESALNGFYAYVFHGFEATPFRTKKHIAAPFKKSSCKRLNMYLRWMTRKDICGVDFGLWKNISPAQLICPLDVHVSRVARKLNLLHRKQNDWLAAVELTECLKKFDASDPIKYDFALFGMGVVEKY